MTNLRKMSHHTTAINVILACVLAGVVAVFPAQTVAAEQQPVVGAKARVDSGKISLSMRKISIAEVMEMLSRDGHVNILLAREVTGEVSVNLFDVTVDEAIRSIATAAGFGVEKRNNSYFIIDRDEVGRNSAGGPTQLRTFKVQYSDPEIVAEILENHLSGYGQITTLPERNMLVVEDTPFFLNRIAKLLRELDRQPKQILIEARILEVVLKDSEAFGLDWLRVFQSGSRSIEIGTQGLANPGSAGFFFDVLSDNAALTLNLLQSRDRLRTLSSPKLLALENQEAETIIGDRLGYRVTTTVDSVTTTSTEFLESGVILKVKPSVDEQNRVLLEIHPEVSTGSVTDDGIPNQTTTEVTTTMLVESGKTVFIGGLIKRSETKSREGVPLLGKIPGLKFLFSNKAVSSINTELVVLITPYILEDDQLAGDAQQTDAINKTWLELEDQRQVIDQAMDELKRVEDSHGEAALPDDADRNKNQS